VSAGRRQELADAAQVIQGLTGATGNTAQVGFENRAEDPFPELPVERLAGLMHDAAARPFEQLHDHVEPQHEQGQHQQGTGIAAVDDTVVHLEHVAGGGQNQQGAEDAEESSLLEEGLQFEDRCTEFRAAFSRSHEDSLGVPGTAGWPVL
jgi:membrane-associated protease RseP (regulator of RpoE activity)